MPIKQILMFAVASAIASMAAAQNYPLKPIRLVVGFPAGGPADIIARTTGQKLSELIGQPVVIDNRGGASGMIAAENVAKSPPDGYTTHLAGVGVMTTNPVLYKKVPYALSDFALVTLAVKVPEALVVHPALPVKTVKEFIALAKARPGELNYGSAGSGGVPHLAAELFNTTAGIKANHIPYKGAAPAVADMLGGHTQYGFWDTPILVPHVNSGKLRALFIATANRWQGFANVPTSAEVGLPSVIIDNWYCIVVPAATPKNIVAQLQGAFAKALQSPEVRDRLGAQGVVTVGSTTEEMVTHLKVETEKWVRVAKATGISLD